MAANGKKIDEIAGTFFEQGCLLKLTRLSPTCSSLSREQGQNCQALVRLIGLVRFANADFRSEETQKNRQAILANSESIAERRERIQANHAKVTKLECLPGVEN